MTIVETPKWVSAHRKLSVLAWIDLVLIILALFGAIGKFSSRLHLFLESYDFLCGFSLLAIVVLYWAYPTAQPVNFEPQNTLDILSIVAAVIVVVTFLLSCVRCHFCRTEREITRFVMSLIVCVSLLVILYAVITQAPSTLITIFFFWMLVRELLFFVVDRQFYMRFYTPTRRRISNALTTTLFILLYAVEVSLSVAVIVIKFQNDSTAGLF
jgi:hypothetical protein